MGRGFVKGEFALGGDNLAAFFGFEFRHIARRIDELVNGIAFTRETGEVAEVVNERSVRHLGLLSFRHDCYLTNPTSRQLEKQKGCRFLDTPSLPASGREPLPRFTPVCSIRRRARQRPVPP